MSLQQNPLSLQTKASPITKQIKRTRLRLVSCNQRLSRAAYLPNRYAF